MRNAAIVAALIVALPVPSSAQTRAAPSTSDAQVHFERGLSLADDGNYSAAMVEFRYAYGITHNPLLLYNIALAHQAQGHYVEALDAMRSYVSDATSHLTPARRAEVDAAITRLNTRIGTLAVPLEAAGLDVRVDGASVDAVRVRVGVPLSVGPHLVQIRAPGFEPREQPVDIVSGVTARLDQGLVPVTTGFTLESNVLDAAVQVDGRMVGRTPMSSAIAVPSGRHHVEVTREGYVSFATDLDVSGPGARVVAPLTWVEPLPLQIASHVRIDAHPEGTRASIDGRPIAFDGRDALPPGVHQLSIEAPDFVPINREIVLSPTSPRRVEAWLQPSSRGVEHLERRRALSATLAIAGGVLFAGGTAASGGAYLLIQTVGVGLLLGVTLPIAIAGLVMGTVTTVRYFTQPTPASYRPPRGREAIRISVAEFAIHWY